MGWIRVLNKRTGMHLTLSIQVHGAADLRPTKCILDYSLEVLKDEARAKVEAFTQRKTKRCNKEKLDPAGRVIVKCRYGAKCRFVHQGDHVRARTPPYVIDRMVDRELTRMIAPTAMHCQPPSNHCQTPTNLRHALANHCQALPCTAMPCQPLPSTAIHCHALPTHCHALPSTAIHCNPLQSTANH